MNLQIFPNWCKKLGVIIFIVFAFLSGYEDSLMGFSDGINRAAYGESYHKKKPFTDYFGEKTMVLFGALSLIGMLIYMLSKESIEDDYINKLRLESYQLSFIIVTFLILVVYLLGFNSDINIETVIYLLLASYLTIFAIKKRVV